YKREDEARVRPLVEALKGAGIDAWWDQDMLPGARIQAVIHEILDKVACVVVAWSALSVESNWVPDEATFGRDHTMLVPLSRARAAPRRRASRRSPRTISPAGGARRPIRAAPGSSPRCARISAAPRRPRGPAPRRRRPPRPRSIRRRWNGGIATRATNGSS